LKLYGTDRFNEEIEMLKNLENDLKDIAKKLN
jgi:hypothetical protein